MLCQYEPASHAVSIINLTKIINRLDGKPRTEPVFLYVWQLGYFLLGVRSWVVLQQPFLNLFPSRFLPNDLRHYLYLQFGLTVECDQVEVAMTFSLVGTLGQ